MDKRIPYRRGFTLIEVLITLTIIGIIAVIAIVVLSSARNSARDAKRKVELTQIGRVLTLGCFVPDAGPGRYDFADLFEELAAKNPKVSEFIASVPRDPARGTRTQSFYYYTVDAVQQCAVYANLENDGERVTLPGISVPTPGGGTGVFESAAAGWNGSTKYYQVSS